MSSFRKLFSKLRIRSSRMCNYVGDVSAMFALQLPFLKEHFRGRLFRVDMPNADGIATFHCRLRPNETLNSFRSEVFHGEWGNFAPKHISMQLEDMETGPITVQVDVGVAE